MGAYHARLGPSSAKRWRNCTASPGASDGMPNEGSDASRNGTACHGVVAECLQQGRDPSLYLGAKFLFCVDIDGKRHEDFADNMNEFVGGLKREHEVEITDEMVGWCQSYCDFVLEQVALTGGTLLVEQRVPIGHITGEDGAGGTSDVVLIAKNQLTVIDAKFGRNKVVAYEVVTPALPDPITGEIMPPVYAPNDQLALYGGGALFEHAQANDFDTVKLIIVQPPLNHVSEYSLTVDALNEFLEGVKVDAEATRTNPVFNAGDHCTFCPARVSCTARDAAVLSIALEGFSDVTDASQIALAIPRQFNGNMLGVLFTKIGMIQSWCNDISTRVYNELNIGGEVIAPDGTGYKLVAGRKGARQWVNEAEAEQLLKRMRLRDDEMYDFKVISPTAADKLANPKAKKGADAPKPIIGKRQWITLQKHINQADPKPVIAPGTDPRDAITPAVSGFNDTSSQPKTDESVDYFN